MLTEKDYEYLIKATGDKAIREKIESTEVQELASTKVHHFAQQDYDILVKNLESKGNSKESYEDGKVVGEEKVIKTVRKELGLDFEGKTLDNLLLSLKTTIETSKEGDIKTLQDDYEKRLKALQDKVSEEEVRANELIAKSKAEKINYKIDSHFNSLDISIPDHIKDEKLIAKFIKTEREKNKLMFKSQYSFEIDENDNIIPVKDGNVLRDEIQNPLALDRLVGDYAKENFISFKTERKGRGEGDRLPSKIANFKSIDDITKFAEQKGIRKNTDEFDALVLEFNKNK